MKALCVCTTHMCMMSVSCGGSCLTCGLTMAGWGIPVAWGPGGPGTMWCENLQQQQTTCTVINQDKTKEGVKAWGGGLH